LQQFIDDCIMFKGLQIMCAKYGQMTLSL